MKQIAFIGTGLMGMPMAKRLLQAGFSLSVYNRTKEKALPLLKLGARWFDSAAGAAASADAVLTMVGTPKDVEELYLGEGGLLEKAPASAVFLDMTTSTPELARRLFEASKGRSLDAPVTGGVAGARSGALSILAGGDQTVFERCAPVFAPLGKATYFGQAGRGQQAKAANQLMIAGILSGVCEGLAFAEEQGLDLELLVSALKTGAAQSRQLETLAPKILSGDFSADFRVKHFIKDLNIATGESKTQLPVARLTAEHLSGLEELGTQALYLYYTGKTERG